jgi:hypothetical protein
VTNACVFSRTALLEIPEEPVSQEAILQYFDKTSDFIRKDLDNFQYFSID